MPDDLIDRTLEELTDQLAEGEPDEGVFMTETRLRLILEALLERLWKLEEALEKRREDASAR